MTGIDTIIGNIVEKRIFKTVQEAVEALRSADSSGGRALCSVWFSAGKVSVHTAHGSGTFTAKEWADGGGPESSAPR